MQETNFPKLTKDNPMNIRKSFGIIFYLSLGIAAFGSNGAWAHAHLESSDPAKNAIVNLMPISVTLHFSEELENSMSKVEIKNLSTGAIISEGKPSYVNDDKSTLREDIKNASLIVKKSQLEVSWKAVSKDSHKMLGKYVFTFDPAAKVKP
jgi:methionine-rich copper-binding protein CopC